MEQQPATRDADVAYIGFWRRFWASLIDSVLLGILVYPVLVGVYGWEYFTSDTLIHGPLDFLLTWVLPAVAIILFWRYKGATPGKMAVHATIVDARSGGRPTTGQLVGRYFAYIPSALVLVLGFLWVGWDSRKQGWHDKLAGTVVIGHIRKGPEPVQFSESI